MQTVRALTGAIVLIGVTCGDLAAETVIRNGSSRSTSSYGRGYSSSSYSYSSETYVMRGVYGRSAFAPPAPIANGCETPAFEVVNPERHEARCAAHRR